ncbi:MAG TPA: ParB/Srx family N-terminal domain-containing protein, partial [Acetobacteraceae bacterium]|nr:ParB/Srx family N-terminal domain-containing protein [Acetobacteraceae bacterium]
MTVPYAKNARTHTDAQVAAIAASIKEWGWTTPALVGEDGGLIAGHARILAARQLGIAEIPVMVAAGWSEAQKRAYVLADNQLAITGSGSCCANTSPVSARARRRASRDGNQRPWPADKVERWAIDRLIPYA